MNEELAVSYHYTFRYADHVSVGDEVLVETNIEFNPVKVIQVSSYVKQGKPFLKYHLCFTDHQTSICFPLNVNRFGAFEFFQ